MYTKTKSLENMHPRTGDRASSRVTRRSIFDAVVVGVAVAFGGALVLGSESAPAAALPVTGMDHTYFRGSQHIKTNVQLSANGRVDGEWVLENDSMGGFCGGVALAFLDANGNILDNKEMPSACINGKPGGHAIKRRLGITLQLGENVVQNVASIRVKAYETSKPGAVLDSLNALKKLLGL